MCWFLVFSPVLVSFWFLPCQNDAFSHPQTYFLFQALELDASNEKALFRRGEALFGMKEFERAKDDFQQVVQLYPANKAAKSQVVESSHRPHAAPPPVCMHFAFTSKVSSIPSQVLLCQKQIKQQHEKDKLIYANMFQKFAERDSKVKSVGVFLKKPPFKRWTWLMGLSFLFFFSRRRS